MATKKLSALQKHKNSIKTLTEQLRGNHANFLRLNHSYKKLEITYNAERNKRLDCDVEIRNQIKELHDLKSVIDIMRHEREIMFRTIDKLLNT